MKYSPFNNQIQIVDTFGEDVSSVDEVNLQWLIKECRRLCETLSRTPELQTQAGSHERFEKCIEHLQEAADYLL